MAHPDEDFSLNYTEEAIELIYNLTHGQPFLVQLIGFQLVRLYNNYIFEKGIKRSETFTVEDVEAVIAIMNENNISQHKYYFTEMWNLVGVEGQQAIIKALAPYPEGLNKEELAKITGREKGNNVSAINTLKRRDIIEEKKIEMSNYDRIV